MLTAFAVVIVVGTCEAEMVGISFGFLVPFVGNTIIITCPFRIRNSQNY